MTGKRGWLVGVVCAVVVVLVGGWWLLSDSDDVLWTRDIPATGVLAATGDRALVTIEEGAGDTRIVDLRTGDTTSLEAPVNRAVSLDGTGGGIGLTDGALVRWDERGRFVWRVPTGEVGYVAAITPDTVVVKVCEGRYGYEGPASLIGVRRADGSAVWRADSLCSELWTSIPPVVVDVGTQPGQLRLRNADTGAVVTSRPVKAAIWTAGQRVVAHDRDQMWALSPDGRELWRTESSASDCPGGFGVFGKLVYGVFPYVLCENADDLGTALIDPETGGGRKLSAAPVDVSAIVSPEFLGESDQLTEGEEADPTKGWAITREGGALVASDWMSGKRHWTRETDDDMSCDELALPADAEWQYGTVLLRCGTGEGAWALDFRTGDVLAHTGYDEGDEFYPLPGGRTLAIRADGTADLVGRG